MIELPNALKQTILYGSSVALMRGISLIMLPFIAHYLTPDEFGRLEILSSLSVIVSILVGLGLAESLYRFAGQAKTPEERKQHAAHIFTLTLFLAIITIALSFIISPLISHLLPGGLTEYDILLVLLILAFEGVISVPLGWLRMQDQAWSFFLTTTGKTLLQAVLIILFLQQDPSVSSVFEAGLIATVLQASVLGYLQVKQTGVRFSSRHTKSVLTYSYPILISGLLAFVLTGLDRWLLAAHTALSDIAEYGIASKFALAVVLLLQPYTMWWSPKRFEVLNQAHGTEKATHFITTGLVILILVTVAVALTAPFIVELLMPEAYLNAINYLLILVMVMTIKEAAELVNIGCFISDKTHTQMWINAAGAALGLGAMIILIPSEGVWGACIALLLAQTLRFILLLVISQKAIKLPYQWSTISLFSGVALCAILLSSQLNAMSQFIIAFIIVSLLTLAAFKLKLVTIRPDFN